jgi:uncharacterized protein YqgC (DUF456 family)
MNWADITAAAIVILVALVGVGLTLVTLPGTWLMVVAALLCQLWRPEMYNWWTLGVVLTLAVIGELIEFGASAMGAAKFGGSKRGAIGATAGSLIGAIAGSPFFFPIGTIAGGVVGAGAGALLAEKALKKKTWDASGKVAAGAAAGRLVATIAKTGVAVAMACVLCIGAFL